MRIPRPLQLVEKSEAAMISAIEIYNKPDYKYREETFALLMVNAWELLLKAKLASEKGDDLSVIFEYENGAIKRNRSGNAQTISIWRAITELENQTSIRLDQAVKANIGGR